jgi:hypothetical protein
MTKKPASPRHTTAVIGLVAENARARAIGRGRRSQLYLWLRAHHDQLAASFAEIGPAWGSIAAHLGNIGLVGGWGDPPAPETVRKAWYLVRRDVAANRAKSNGSAADDPTLVVTFTSQPASTSPVPPAPVTPPTDDPAPPERRFRMARLRSAPAASAVRDDPPSASPPNGEPGPAIDPEEVLARLFGNEPSHRFIPPGEKER